LCVLIVCECVQQSMMLVIKVIIPASTQNIYLGTNRHQGSGTNGHQGSGTRRAPELRRQILTRTRQQAPMGTKAPMGTNVPISSFDTPFPASTSTLEMACRRLKWEQPDRQCANGDAQTKYDMPKLARPIFHFRRIGRPCLLERRVLTRCERCPFPASTTQPFSPELGHQAGTWATEANPDTDSTIGSNGHQGSGTSERQGSGPGAHLGYGGKS